MHARHLWEVLLQQVVGPHHQVALLVALDMDICHLQVTVKGRGERLVHHLHLQCILQFYGKKYGFQIVIAVWSAFYDIQS